MKTGKQIIYLSLVMAKVCPMKGCKEKEGMCIHDKMMMWVVVIIVLVVIAKVYGWF